jgi:plasmid stability protein
MAKMIQLRNVPDDLHRRLKQRAARENMSLSDYLIREVRAVAERPTVEDIIARIEKRPAVRISESSADAVRAEREARR